MSRFFFLMQLSIIAMPPSLPVRQGWCIYLYSREDWFTATYSIGLIHIFVKHSTLKSYLVIIILSTSSALNVIDRSSFSSV